MGQNQVCKRLLLSTLWFTFLYRDTCDVREKDRTKVSGETGRILTAKAAKFVLKVVGSLSLTTLGEKGVVFAVHLVSLLFDVW